MNSNFLPHCKDKTFFPLNISEKLFPWILLSLVFGDFELEDDKLALLDIIKGSIYDWDHRLVLVDQFLIERNRNKANQLLSQ